MERINRRTFIVSERKQMKKLIKDSDETYRVEQNGVLIGRIVHKKYWRYEKRILDPDFLRFAEPSIQSHYLDVVIDYALWRKLPC